jgi:hypothetical protein
MAVSYALPTTEENGDIRRLAQDRSGLFESADGQWRIANPYKLTTELRHRWLVAQRHASGSGWCMHDGDHATLYDARAYVQSVADVTPPGKPSAHRPRPS